MAHCPEKKKQIIPSLNTFSTFSKNQQFSIYKWKNNHFPFIIT